MNQIPNLVDAFERLCANGTAPDLDAFLSDAGAVNSAQLARLARIDQRERWRRGDRRLAEEYLDRYPALQTDRDHAVDLIYHEFLLRDKTADRPTLDEFAKRFPQHATALTQQVDFHRALVQADDNRSGSLNVGSPVDALPALDTNHAAIYEASAAARNPAANLRRLGRYELVEIIGAGSFGTVYKARDPELDRIVAIKVPRHDGLAGNAGLERFLREARSIAQLRHPSIVSVHEIGQSELTPYLVTEFVHGKTLADRLSSRPPGLRESAALVATLADALHYAHEMGVVHRDVKPANIMLDEKGAPRLMDFGLARRDATDATMTTDGQVLGTPAYMSPEQARGESRKVDRRSDVYSLGVVLYQLLTGKLPFDGAAGMLLHQVLHDEPPRPRSISSRLPRDLETICLRAMSKQSSARYATARELASDLRRFLQDEPIHARHVTAVERVWRWCRRQPALASLSAILFMLLLSIALGGTAVVSLLLAAIAAGGTLAAVQFRRQALQEKLLRDEADENLYYHRIALAHQTLTASPPHPGRAEELLDACPTDRRNWEWHYLRRLWRAEQDVLCDTGSSELRGIAFSRDGQHLAAACGDGKLRVWNLKTGDLTVLSGHDGFAYSVAFDPTDGNRLASSGNDGLVRVWDISARREAVHTHLPGTKVFAVGMAHSVAFSPNGKRLAAVSEADDVRIWDAGSGRSLLSLTGHEIQASSVAYSADGQFVATGSWLGIVRVWNAQTGQLLQKLQLPDHLHPVAGLAFCSDPGERHLAAAYLGGQVDVWDFGQGVIYRRLERQIGFVTAISFHPFDGRRLATAGEDRVARVWDLPSRREVLRLQGHTDQCSGLTFGPHGDRLASSSYDRTIRLWDATKVAESDRQELQVFAVDHQIMTVAIDPVGSRVAAAGMGPAIHVWETVSGTMQRNMQTKFKEVVFSVAISSDGSRMIAAGFDGGAPPCVVKIISLGSGETLFEHREGQEIFAAAISPDGRWLAFGLSDGSVRLVELETARSAITVGKHDRPIVYGGLKFRHDGLRLASASVDGTLCVWDLSSLRDSSLRTSEITAEMLPADRRLLFSHAAGSPFWSISYRPDGCRLVTGGKDGRLQVWDADAGKKLDDCRIDAAHGACVSAAYTPNGRWIISASEDCTVQVYDAQSLLLVHRFRGHLGPIHCLAVSNQFAATGGTDRTVRVWDLRPLSR